MSGTSGRTSRTPFAFFDPESRSLRTSQDTFDLGLPTSSPILPASGSMRSGALYAHRRSALPTDASGCSSSPQLPTPTARDWKGEGYEGQLPNAVVLLKTPTAQLAINGGSQHPDKRKAGGHGPTLADEVEHLLPTPRASDGAKDGPNQRDSKGDLALPSAVVQLLPTPTVADSRGTRNATSGRTNPDSKHHAGTTLNNLVFDGSLLPTPRASDTGTPGRRASEGWRPPLSQVVLPLMPTPTAADSERTSTTYCRGNPTLHGAVSTPQSAVGNTPPDDAAHGQLTIEDA
jgi:hypothetical protein